MNLFEFLEKLSQVEEWEKLDKIRDEVFGPENYLRGTIMFKSHIREGQILGETENLVLIRDPYFN